MNATLLCLALTAAPADYCYPRYRSYYNYCYPVRKVRIKTVPVAVYAPFAVAVQAYGASYYPGYGTPPPGVSGGAAVAPGLPAPAGAVSGFEAVVAEIRKLNSNLAAINAKVDAQGARLAALEARAALTPPPARPPGRPPARKPPAKPPKEDDEEKDEDKDKGEQQVFLAHAAARCSACHTGGANPKGDFELFKPGTPARLAALAGSESPLARLEKPLARVLGRLSDRALARLEDESFNALDADTLTRIGDYVRRGKCPPEGNDQGVPALSEDEKQSWAAWVKAAKENVRKTARPGKRMRFVRRDL